MGGNQEFWEQLKQKYEEKNRTLLQKEQELQLKLEAMNSIIEDQKKCPPIVLPKCPSCICPEPEEKPGFFSGLLSIFGSSKPQPKPALDPSPPAPQDFPTKENSRDAKSISKNSTVDPNCACDPCEADMEEVQRIYSIPKKTSKDSGDYCNCSVCSRVSLPGWSDKQCPCNLVNLGNDDTCEGGVREQDTSFGNKNKNARKQPGLSSPSKLSLKSMDLFYMQNIQDLASQQKDLLKHINDLEQKAKVYENVFSEYRNIDFGKDQCKSPCPEMVSEPEQKTTAELKLENFLLKNELKDMRLEVRQYLERMEGPMQFKIESEKYKCIQLEQKLEEAAKDRVCLQELYEREMNTLKMQLCNANANVYELTAKVEQIEVYLVEYQNKCTKLEDDLIRQKISEAETIKSLQAALKAQDNANVVKDECDLHQIARELSKILKECEPCGTCMNLPEDLTQAASLLKSLTDMIESKLNKGESTTTPENNTIVPRTSTPRNSLVPTGMDTLEISTIQEQKGGSRMLQGMSITVVSPPPSNSEPPEPLKPSESPVPSEPSEPLKPSESPVPSVPSEPPKPPEEVAPQQEDAEPDKESEPNIENEELDLENLDAEIAQCLALAEIADEPCLGLAEIADKPCVGLTEIADKPCHALDPTKSKLSCPCVNFKRSTQVDQLWPKTDVPIELKESEVLDTAPEEIKKKCECKVYEKMKESYDQEKCEGVKNQLIPKSALKKNCKCNAPKEQPPPPPCPPENEIVPCPIDDNERFKLSHLVTASRSKDILKSETSIKCLKVKENFPFDVDTQVDVLNKSPDGVHVTTTITNSGTLEVITEGPEGVIETTLVYTKSGNVEVVTEILHHPGKGKVTGKEKPLAIEGPEVKGAASEPGKNLDTKVDRTGSGPAAMNAGCICKQCPIESKAKCACIECPNESKQVKPTCLCADCEDVQPKEPVINSCICTECPGESKQTGDSCICQQCPFEAKQGEAPSASKPTTGEPKVVASLTTSIYGDCDMDVD